MKTCPKIVHTVKGRERALNYVSKLKELDSNEQFIYKLYHQYDSNPCDIYVKTNIKPSVFELLLVNILFEASEIEETYALGQEEIAKPILNGLYGVEVLEENTHYDEEFDLYYIWEKWCGVYDSVRNLEVLKHDKLKDELIKIVPIYKEHN